jgi:copper chaperone CopZ
MFIPHYCQKPLLFLSIFMLLWSSFSIAAGRQYEMRVDGLACPFCAYGIEKKFIKTTGVNSVDINLVKGLVVVKTAEGKTFSIEKLKTIINDAGFTMRSVRETNL